MQQFKLQRYEVDWKDIRDELQITFVFAFSASEAEGLVKEANILDLKEIIHTELFP